MNNNFDKNALYFSSKFIEQREYWIKKLSGVTEEVERLFEVNETKQIKERTREVDICLSNILYNQLVEVCKNNDLAIYIFILSVFKTLIYRYTNKQYLPVMSPLLMQNICEDTINDRVLIFNKVEPNMTFKDLLIDIRKTVLEAYQNQDYPYEKILEHVFNFQNKDDKKVRFDIACSFENIHHKENISKLSCDLSMLFYQDDDQLRGKIVFNADLYDREFVEQMAKHFLNILEASLSGLDTKLAELPILKEEEKSLLIKKFNENKFDLAGINPVHQLIEERAKMSPNSVAIVYNGVKVTYKELNEKANQIARTLIENGITKDEPVGILLDRSPLMIESILAVWKAGGAYIPLDNQYPNKRILQILEDSEAKVLITISDYVGTNFQKAYNKKIIKMDIDSDITKKSVINCDVEVDLNSLAYIIYTSGSTGKPKGVMVEHLGMLNHMYSKINELRINEKTVIAQNSSHTFDISIWQFFCALIEGGSVVIYSNETVLDLDRFIFLVIKDGITILEVVPSYLALMLDRLETINNKFEVIEYLLVTGEIVKPSLIKKWFQMYPDVKVVNAYGPTEASDDITHFIMDRHPNTSRISIGKPIQNLNIYIVDKNMQLCPIGVKGEICVSGIGVGRGYIRNEEKTRQVFMDDPFIKDKKVRLYKTGDIGIWLKDGTIDFYGREDNQVKIRGFRIELGEIENNLMENDNIKEAVVIDKEDEQGNKYLCAYIKVRSQISETEIKNYLLSRLPDYMIPSSFIKLKKFPVTINGKLDRKALSKIASDSEIMKFISSEEMREVKQAKERKANVSRNKQLGLKDSNNYCDLYTNNMKKIDNYSEKIGKTLYPLSLAQRMFYYIEKVYSDSTCCNDICTIRYTEELDAVLLNKAINSIIESYEVLRLRVIDINSSATAEPVQYISDFTQYSLDYFDFSNKSDEDIDKWVYENTNKPFDIIDNDLFYFAYIKYTERETGYLIKLHHLINDGWSLDLLCSEINRVYKQLKLMQEDVAINGLNNSYIKHILDERSYLESNQFKVDRRFWHSTLLPIPEDVNISTKKGDEFNIKANSIKLSFPKALNNQIYNYCKENHVSFFKILSSAFAIYISKITSIEDVIIGCVNHGRVNKSNKRNLGLFSKFIPLRVKVDHKVSFNKFLNKDFSIMLQKSLMHYRYPYQVLTSELSRLTGVDLKYLSNIIIVDHSIYDEEDFRREIHLTEYESNPLTIHINLNNSDGNKSIELHWLYQVEQFDEIDIKNMHKSLMNIINNALKKPDMPIWNIDIMSDSQKKCLISEFNNTKRDYPKEKLVHTLIEEQAARNPNKIAIVYDNKSLTYKQLNMKANQLAYLLKSKGVKADSIIGLRVNRSLEIIVGILAILKAGGAFLPIGLEYPDERVKYMLEECMCEIILTDSDTYNANISNRNMLLINISDDSIYKGKETNLLPMVSSNSLAYILYTSGSTGLPKGVMIEHRSLLNFITGILDVIDFKEEDSILSLISASFDIFILETILPLTKGMKVVIGSLKEQADNKAMAQMIKSENITVLQVTPSMLQLMVVDNEAINSLSSLRFLLVGGEVFLEALHEKLTDFFKGRIYNLYGPTETTIWSTVKEVSHGETLNIGKPIANTQVYILSKNSSLQGIGVVGELCIGGDGVARGYIGKEELTNQKFISNPFIEGGHLYKTGDLARWLPDGNIEFLGRKDFQVKINGLRIELGEIENNLLNYKGITDAAVVVRKEDENKVIYAFIVAEKKLTVSEVRKYLYDKLPLYMIPLHFIQLEKIPLLISGKTNRKLLESLEIEVTNNEKQIMPSNYLEQVIASVWEEVTGRNNIGINDNFFDIGGNSIKLIEVNSKLKQKISEDIPIVIMFQYPTISSLYKYLSQKDSNVSFNENGKSVIARETIEEAIQLFEEVSKPNRDE